MMFNNIKLAFNSFKKNYQDYLAISFVFGVLLFLGILIGRTMLGMLLAYIVIAIPAIISLKFVVFQSYDKPKVEYRSLKVGFMTLFKSIKIYFIVVLKPFLIALLVAILTYSIFLSIGINIGSQTIPNLMETLANQTTFEYAYDEMMSIASVKNIVVIGEIVAAVIGFLVFYSLKLKRDFIPFMAFEIPISSKRAITMNEKILKGKYIKFLLTNFCILLLFAVPGGLAYLTGFLMSKNEVLSVNTIFFISMVVFCVVAAPIVLFKQLFYIWSYKEFSKPFKEDFDNELKNVIKEIEELQKMINQDKENKE